MRLSEELCCEAAGILQERYGDFLDHNETFEFQGTITEKEAEVQVLVRSRESDAFTRIDIRHPFDDCDEEEALAFAIDAADAFVGEWLEGGRRDRLSIDYVDLLFDDKPVQVRIRKSRPSLEATADALLNDSGL